MISAFVLISARPDRIADLASELADVEGVAEVYSVAGDVDVIAIVRVHEHEQLADVVTGHIARLYGVVSTRSMVAYRAYSRHDLEAMFALGSD
ncbi:MAG: Lrp/AsnC ligand binding domain-containing protein [Actinobacteria bacterium]|nr:Lrp/AsnC ligand binding domain-containing protein [Actinomycetota bacterium]